MVGVLLNCLGGGLIFYIVLQIMFLEIAKSEIFQRRWQQDLPKLNNRSIWYITFVGPLLVLKR